MPQREATALLLKLREFAADPFVSHIPGRCPWPARAGRYRIRQGDWRAVVFIVRAEDAVIVERIDHRREAYR